MSNLYIRLMDGYKSLLEQEIEKYPHAIRGLKEELSEVNNWIDLKYGTAISLTMFLHLSDYSPTTMSKLFDDEKH